MRQFSLQQWPNWVQGPISRHSPPFKPLLQLLPLHLSKQRHGELASFVSMKHLLVPTIILALLPYALAWGSFGHRTVAYLAQSLLSRDARTYIADVLKGQDISDAAIWPDQIRHYHEWSYTAEWHYIDAQDDPPKSCGINYRRDCASESGCVVSAITNMVST